MEKEKLNNQNKLPKYSFTIVSDYFLDEWAGVVGVGPTALYVHLLKYCYKGKDEAWPALRTLCKKMGIGRSTLIRYRQVLINHGLIKKIIKRKSSRGYFKNNIYQLTLKLESLKQKKEKDRGGPRTRPEIVPKWNQGGSNLIPGVVSKWDHNNNKEKNYQENNNKKIVAANFKKSKEEERRQIIREQLADLDFKERFIEQLIKDFNLKKIEEKLELLMAKRNIQNPAGWLRTALKYDYKDVEKERCDEEEKEITKETKILLNIRAREKKESLPKEEALKRIGLAKKMLANL